MGIGDYLGYAVAPMTFGSSDLITRGLSGGSQDLPGLLGIGSGDPSNPYRQGASDNAANAAGFAADARNNYNTSGVALQQQRDYLNQIAGGQQSIAAEQLRQGLQQNLAAQRSMAASASPANSAMAARTAAIQSARIGSGMAGQQALAGLQERRDAENALAQLNLGQRGQDVNAAIGGYGAANQGYGTALGTPQQTWGNVLMGGLQGAAGYGAKAASDRNLKTEIADGDGDTSKALDGLKAYVFRYKDEKHGKGKQLGIMAQDLESAGLGHAVINTPEGKMVHGAKLATSLAAMLPGLHKRISKLEGK